MGCSPSTPQDHDQDTNESQETSKGNVSRDSRKHKNLIALAAGVKDQSTNSNQTSSTKGRASINIVLNSRSSKSSDGKEKSSRMTEARYSDKQETSGGNSLEGEMQIRLGPLSVFRRMPLRVGLIFPKEDSLYSALLSGCDRLNWDTGVRFTSISDQVSYLAHSPVDTDLLLLDYRQQKLIPQNVMNLIRGIKDENPSLVIIAFVKKSFTEKCDSALSSLISEAGVDWAEIDSGITSATYWQHQLSQYERSFVIPSMKLSAARAVLAAADACRDMIQITDSSHRVLFVNRAYERLMGYSSEEISGNDFIEVQNQNRLRHQQQYCNDEPQQKDGSPTGPILSTTTSSVMGGRASPQQGQTTQVQLYHPPPFNEHVVAELVQGKEYDGTFMFHPKAGDPFFLPSRVLPFTNEKFGGVSGKSGNDKKSKPESTHFIYVSEVPLSLTDKSLGGSDVVSSAEAGYPMPRGSLKSLRKASYDIKSISTNDSSILRRQSLAKLHSLTIEAPITKVINIIAAAQQSCPPYIAQALERVLEILRTTELYSPQLFEGGSKIKSDDPLTTDLLGALLSQGPRLSLSVRRSSNENNASRLAPRPSLPDIAEAPTSIQKLLETEGNWSFDVIRLEEISDKRPLVWLGMTTFARFGVAQILGTDEATLRNWLTLIEANYHGTNPYHNSTHAADVMQATAYFLSTERLNGFLEPLDEVIALLAAVVHDVDHPGKTSPFLINCGNDMALLYNDLSVLESHHAAFTFKLTLSDPRVNIFANLDTETFKVVRQSLIDMVLATEMTKHFEHLSKFVNVFTKPFLKDEDGPSDHTHTPVTPTEPDISTLITPENVVLVKRMLIKCADVGNPTRPVKQCVEWARRISEEYFKETEEALARGLPPVMPGFDRTTCHIPKSQMGFIDYFIADMYEAWDAFLDVPEVIQHMKYNYDYWKEQDRIGGRHATLNESYILTHPPPEASPKLSIPGTSKGLEQSQL